MNTSDQEKNLYRNDFYFSQMINKILIQLNSYRMCFNVSIPGGTGAS